MYIFWFLHQTTTNKLVNQNDGGCISFDSYIKPQLKLVLPVASASCISFDSYIKPQLPSFVKEKLVSCISFDSYIKPQLLALRQKFLKGCISFDSYIKPQQCICRQAKKRGCISFDSYIKPQLRNRSREFSAVVYLLIPTSNHNRFINRSKRGTVVYLLIPTSNHNYGLHRKVVVVLYIFWFLHQTTTGSFCPIANRCCISFDSYIKPQPQANINLADQVVYLLIPTSNHNLLVVVYVCSMLYIFWFLHQTTTLPASSAPQKPLYIFWFLHQTTTMRLSITLMFVLYIFWFLHQTTTLALLPGSAFRCISFDSYIKPQHLQQ